MLCVGERCLRKMGNETDKLIRVNAADYVTTGTLKPTDGSYIDYAVVRAEYDLKDRQITTAFLMATSGKNKVDIAAAMGMSRNTIYTWLKNPSFLKLYNDLCAFSLKAAQGRALAKMQGLMDSEDEKMVYKSAEFILKTNMGMVEGITVAREKDATEDLFELLKNGAIITNTEVKIPKPDYDRNAPTKHDKKEDIYDPSEVLE